MVHAWGGFSNGQIPYSAMRQVTFFNGVSQWFEPDMADRMEWLRDQTGITCQEGYRPLGVPSDQYVTSESQTASGRSSQWYWWGVYNRGGVPSAGYPGTSSHGWGLAADITPGRENSNIVAACAQVGLLFTVASESWHVAADGTPSVNYKKQDEMKLIINNKTKVVYTIAPGFLHHVVGQDEIDQATEVCGPMMVKDPAYFDVMLRAFGVPADQAQKVMGGKTWVASSGVNAAVDVSAIVKAVNDDVARRMTA